MAQVRFFAAAAAAFKANALTVPASSTAVLRDRLIDMAPPGAEAVLGKCSMLVDGVIARTDVPLRDETIVDILPPFAGG